MLHPRLSKVAIVTAIWLAIAYGVVGVHLADVPKSQPAATPDAHELSSPSHAPHFSARTYGMLRSSGDRVGHAVQRVLGVQGSLDDLKEDLAVESTRWKAKQQEYLAERERLLSEIQGYQTTLREQSSRRAEAERLRGHLALAKHVHVKMDQTYDETRQAWKRKQEELQQEAADLLSEINSTREASRQEVAEVRSHTKALLQNGSKLVDHILGINKTITALQESRTKQAVEASQERAGLLNEAGKLAQQKANFSEVLQEQNKLEWEYHRLLVQAHTVVQERQKLTRGQGDCDDKIRDSNAELATISRKIHEDTARLRQCQLMDAENEGLQDRANRCKAAKAAMDAGG